MLQEIAVWVNAEALSGPTTPSVVYTSKDGKIEQTFDAIDWLARLVVHIPDKYEQLVRYVGDSNKFRGMRKKAGTDDAVPSIASEEPASKQFAAAGRG